MTGLNRRTVKSIGHIMTPEEVADMLEALPPSRGRALAAFLTLLVFWFCTPAGFLPGVVVAAIIVVLGVVFLREKPVAAH